ARVEAVDEDEVQVRTVSSQYASAELGRSVEKEDVVPGVAVVKLGTTPQEDAPGPPAGIIRKSVVRYRVVPWPPEDLDLAYDRREEAEVHRVVAHSDLTSLLQAHLQLVRPRCAAYQEVVLGRAKPLQADGDDVDGQVDRGADRPVLIGRGHGD